MALSHEKKEQLAKEMSLRKAQDCLTLIRSRSDERNKYRNLTRYMQIQKSQLESADKIEHEKQAVALQSALVAKKEKLAQEIVKKKNEELSESLLRQQIRRDSYELRDLERKLKAAYVNKQLLTQLAERESERQAKKFKDKEVMIALEAARMKSEDYQKVQQEKEMKQKAKYKQELQDQMILVERTKRFQYEEFLREKKKIDDIVQRAHDEDERELQEKQCRIQRTREEMMKFKEAQELWKQKDRMRLQEEDRKLTEYVQAKAREQHIKEMNKAHSDKQNEERMENIAREMYLRQQRDSERQTFVEILKEEEILAEYRAKDQRELEKKIKLREETKQVLDYQLKEREDRIKKEAEEDAKYVEQLLAKMAEENRLEQMSAGKARMRLLQLKKDAVEQTKARRQMYAEKMQEEIRIEEERVRQEKRKQQIIDEERLKMLQEHAKNVIGFLQPGVLQEKDLEYLDCEVVEEYRKKEGL
nr:meiosis-specific nuclear structural protein 1 [Onthophagus taurus]